MSLSFRQFHILHLLQQFEKQKWPLDRFLNHYFRTHTAIGSKDRKEIADTLYEMTRWQLLLDTLAGKESTAATRYAIFQGFQPSNFLSITSLAPHIRVSFPEELFNKLKENYGEEEAFQLCQVCNTKAPLCIRVNPLKTTREKLLQKLQKDYLVTPTRESPLGIQFKERATLLQLPEYKEGHFEIQDEASQLVSDLVPVQPHDRLLDFCAGAGGKTLGALHKLQGKGEIYLHDTRPHVLMEAKKRLQRAGVMQAHYLQPHDSKLKLLQGSVDCLILDVPCSGSGTLRRNPDQKWRFSLSMLNKFIETQREIFQEAFDYVKPGGAILYSTCSLLKEENEMQIAHFLEKFPVTLEKTPFASKPTFAGMDGLFAAHLRKIS